jgi:hypothetical protein
LLPYKLLASTLLQLPGSDIRIIRLAAALIGLANTGLFFMLAKRWYGLVNGLTLTLLYAVNGWTLQTSRFGAGYSCLALAVLGLMNIVVWVNNTERSGPALIGFSAAAVVSLYIPGGLWLLAIAAFVCRNALREHLRAASSRNRIIAGATVGLGLLSIIAVLVQNSGLWRQWLGLPAAWPSITELGKQAALGISGLVARGPYLPENWLAHTPILDVAATALFVLGLLFYSRHIRNSRTHLLGLFWLAGIILTMLNGAAALTYIVPVIYLILGGGFAFMLHQWKKVFPRNPIAEALSLITIGCLLVTMFNYHIQRYFVAWRHSPTVVATYHHAGKPGGEHLPYLVQ